jgi:hypothetical protein
MTQRIDVSSLATEIDRGGVDFELSAWLGGYSTQNDRAAVFARFMNDANTQTGVSQLAAVTNVDRGNVTMLMFREMLGDLPVTTRFIDIQLVASRSIGENDGYADNISLVLGATGDLNFDGAINSADWAIFRAGQHRDMTGFTRSQSLASGDLNADFRNDFIDFQLFKSVFEVTNGDGSFAKMLASVPEPPAIWLGAVVMAINIGFRRRTANGLCQQ